MDNPSSPNQIPRRTSSVGFRSTPIKPVLRPLSEDNWLRPRAVSDQQGTSKRSISAMAGAIPQDDGEYTSDSDFGSDLIARAARNWPRDKEKIVLAPYDYMESHPGKDVRSELIKAFDALLDVRKESLDVITKVIGMLHTSSLLIDDVEDDSLLRRGVPVAHSIFGTPQTINSANYVYFLALKELQNLQNPEAIAIFTEELLNLHRGQGMDLWWRDTLTCPTEAEYLEMVDNKTGGLFRLAVKLMQAESRTRRNCVPLVNAIGLIYQILDDYKNLSSEVYMENKGLAEDLTEGKFSFLIIHCIRSSPSNPVLLNILKQKPKDDDVKRYAISHMERMGSFSYTRARLKELSAKAMALADEMELAAGKGTADGIRRILRRMRVEQINKEENLKARYQQQQDSTAAKSPQKQSRT